MSGNRSRVVLVVAGLQREAKLVAGDGRQVVLSGGSRAALERRLGELDPGSLSAVISFGLAGGLAPDLHPGAIVIPRSVVSREGSVRTNDRLRAGWTGALARAGISLHEIDATAGVDAPVLTPADKAALRNRTGAAAVDMESHVAAAFAAKHALPFGVLRVISDGAERALPPLAGKAMRPDGGIDVGAVILGLLREPGQLPALIRTGREAETAFRRLAEIVAVLGAKLDASGH
jgi:hopanoid-associated phosphorylase